jgi:hypothetical protein
MREHVWMEQEAGRSRGGRELVHGVGHGEHVIHGRGAHEKKWGEMEEEKESAPQSMARRRAEGGRRRQTCAFPAGAWQVEGSQLPRSPREVDEVGAGGPVVEAGATEVMHGTE